MSEFRYSNVEKEMEVYGYDAVVKSHCRMCHGRCGVLVYTKNGRVEKIAGDPDCPRSSIRIYPKRRREEQTAVERTRPPAARGRRKKT